MTKHLDLQILGGQADLVSAPVERQQRACEDRTFELPRALHLGTVALFMLYMAIMAAGFRHQELVIPMAINFIFIGAAFGVPALWAIMKPENSSRALGMDTFIAKGVDCLTGRLDARSATVQVLIMPVMILLWGVAAATIARLV